MCKYIDAEKLSELCKRFDASSNKNFLEEQILSFLYHIFIPKVLEETPHVDAVEVVRCKDCKFYHTKKCKLENPYQEKEDDFCSCGEQKRSGE